MNPIQRSALVRVRQRRAEASKLSWPSPRYEKDILGFARDVLGLRTWSKQREFLQLMQNHKRVAVRAGHKVSKSNSVIIRVLQFYCSYPDAQVYITAPTFAQVKDVLWRELRQMRNKSGVCLDCRDAGETEPCEHSCRIDGTLNKSPLTGLVSGERIIKGFSVNDADSISGRSGVNLLWVIDESVGVPDDIWEAILATLAGGAWLIVVGNPTEPQGEFFEAFHSKSKLYASMAISSLDSPNVTGECTIPGLATKEWCQEKLEEWGEDSQAYQTRVLGNFAKRGSETMIGPEDVVIAQQRWETQETDPAGVLSIGIDVAGQAMGNDSWSFGVRRGKKIVSLTGIEGFDTQDAVDHLDELLNCHLQNGECPQVAFDGSSYMGSQFALALAAYVRKYPGRIAPRRLQPSGASPNDRFFRLRDYLIWNLVDHVQRDLAIPADPLLEEELLALKWDLNKSDSAGLDKVIDKKILRKLLKRSPDRCDCCSYACFGMDRDGGPVVVPVAQRIQQQQRARLATNPHTMLQGFNPHNFKL